MTAAPQTRRARPTVAVLGALALAIGTAAPLTMQSEGIKTDATHQVALPYKDKLGKGQPVTICFGNTGYVRFPDGTVREITMTTRFAKAHCLELLKDREKQDALPIYYTTPAIAQYPHTWAAIIDFTHNFNLRTYQNSSMAREFGRGNWLAGCDALLAYNKGTIRGKRVVLPGLKTRRIEERRICRIDHVKAQPKGAK